MNANEQKFEYWGVVSMFRLCKDFASRLIVKSGWKLHCISDGMTIFEKDDFLIFDYDGRDLTLKVRRGGQVIDIPLIYTHRYGFKRMRTSEIPADIDCATDGLPAKNHSARVKPSAENDARHCTCNPMDRDCARTPGKALEKFERFGATMVGESGGTKLTCLTIYLAGGSFITRERIIVVVSGGGAVNDLSVHGGRG